MRNQFGRLAVTLMLIAGFAAGALALVDSFTAPRIAKAKAEALERALTEALPGAAAFKEDRKLLAAVKKEREFAIVTAVYRAAASDGSPAGLVVTVTPRGYGGPIELMVGLRRDGTLAAVRVLAQSETPGLGSKVAEEDFLRGFRGAKAGERLAVNKDGGRINAVAGATISSRAVTQGVNVALALAARAGL
ncbi:MAG: RnfABCDGE type electron transport complex subunit G [Bacillota bacterium]